MRVNGTTMAQYGLAKRVRKLQTTATVDAANAEATTGNQQIVTQQPGKGGLGVGIDLFCHRVLRLVRGKTAAEREDYGGKASARPIASRPVLAPNPRSLPLLDGSVAPCRIPAPHFPDAPAGHPPLLAQTAARQKRA